MPSIFDWSATASSNTAIDGINCNTGMTPANTDNLFRSLAAIIRGSFSSTLQNFLAGIAGLPISSGGTGATTAADALTALGALDDDYRDLLRTDKTSGFTLANAERSYAIAYTGAAGVCTVPPNTSVSINVGATYVIHNNGTGALTLTRGSGVTLRSNGSTTSADAVLAVGGTCSLVKWSNDYWTVTGSGLS